MAEFWGTWPVVEGGHLNWPGATLPMILSSLARFCPFDDKLLLIHCAKTGNSELSFGEPCSGDFSLLAFRTAAAHACLLQRWPHSPGQSGSSWAAALQRGSEMIEKSWTFELLAHGRANLFLG